jgi:hypothetical protein
VVLTLTTKSVRVLDYEITPPAEEDRQVVIDESRPDGWKPAERPGDVELTASRIRYSIHAPKGATTTATLKLERTDRQTVRLSTLRPREIYTTLRGLENTTPELKQALQELSDLVSAINAAERQRNGLQNERASIAEDHDRIRKNLQTVDQSSDLGRRYLDTLREQEDRLNAIRGEIEDLDAAIAAREKEAVQVANGWSFKTVLHLLGTLWRLRRKASGPIHVPAMPGAQRDRLFARRCDDFRSGLPSRVSPRREAGQRFRDPARYPCPQGYWPQPRPTRSATR